MGHKCSQKCPRSESLMQMKARLMKDEKANTCLCFKEEKKGREPSLAQGHLGSRQEASRHPCDSLLPYFVCSGTRPVPWAKQKPCCTSKDSSSSLKQSTRRPPRPPTSASAASAFLTSEKGNRMATGRGGRRTRLQQPLDVDRAFVSEGGGERSSMSAMLAGADSQ
ncbi:uncharacterized protein LOC133496039 isoform X3 [Syngnathoides biaculeatus]|uniref:uncharacterized protein LOC133496039 isoform X3 n=1 Tax=Syngnathoides biaculeatus TaxID=300417 RepID=UPI002ADE1503|nr:uncharacterized protein LOC133496039 isoform X3 [Syngnathoides biaculeatus]